MTNRMIYFLMGLPSIEPNKPELEAQLLAAEEAARLAAQEQSTTEGVNSADA